MNFAGRNLKYVNTATGNLSPRERTLLAENKKLKRRNKRLSSAMLFLVDHVEARLPFLNGPSKEKSQTKTPSAEVYQPSGRSKKPTLAERVEKHEEIKSATTSSLEEKTRPPSPQKEVKQTIVGTAWTPEKLEPSREAPTNPTPTRPLSIQQVFAEKKKSREEQVDDGVSIPEIPEAATPPVEASISTESPADESVENAAHHAPELAPEERDILAAPTREKTSGGALASSEIIKARKEEKKSAAEASMAYQAVSTVSRPVPEDIKSNSSEDNQEMILDEEENPSLTARAAQHNVMREAMLRRVNRLRW